MMLETSLVCGEDGSLDVGRGTMRLHVEESSSSPEYLIGVDDACFLSSIGISAGRHRSPAKRLPLPPIDSDDHPRT